MSQVNHAAAVAAVTEQIQELQTRIGMAREKADELADDLHGAIGNSLHPSACNAFVQTMEVVNGLPPMIGRLESAIQEMHTYKEVI